VVTSIHDVSFIEHPEYFTGFRRRQLEFTVSRTARTASRIITVSEFSRTAIAQAYSLDPERITVVPNAANPFFRVINREAAQKSVREIFRFDSPFVLSVGDLQPRKNHSGLIEAFSRLIKSRPQLPHRLIIAGQDTWFGGRVREAARNSGVEDRISFTGFVSDEDLLRLYNACDCFVFPSFYEGFGIPILEAMACGRAVACSNTSAMPEVADGAGLLFDPTQPDEIARAMRDILIDGELRSRMERLGLQRAAGFSWQKSAQLTLQVYEQVAGREATLSRAPLRRVPVKTRSG
jgi:glycosyltransferase involved in cell wall biosynthesis